MRTIILCLVFSSFLSACAILYQGQTDSFNKEIKLLEIKSYQNDILISLFSKQEFELLIPLRTISKYTYIKNESELEYFCFYISSLLKNKSNDRKIQNSKFGLNDWISGKFTILQRDLFESGDFLIYNNKTNNYIEKVVVRWESWYAGPLAASFDLWVYIGDFVLYEDHVMA